MWANPFADKARACKRNGAEGHVLQLESQSCTRVGARTAEWSELAGSSVKGNDQAERAKPAKSALMLRSDTIARDMEMNATIFLTWVTRHTHPRRYPASWSTRSSNQPINRLLWIRLTYFVMIVIMTAHPYT